jgi:hypothetical protein
MEPNISNESSFPFARQRFLGMLWLALAATATALSISALAGWQRGGSLSERLVWISISVVLVVSAHVLPGFVRGSPVAVRCVACSLWIACMATTCYGHATFFVLAQRHAGELRASPTPAAPVANSVRSLSTVMAERATVIRQLATARARYCAGKCVTLEARRVTLAARLDALDTEADDIRRRHIADDRVTQQRDALLADPVASRLAALLGVTEERIDLLSGLAFAAVLEMVACLLWTLALRPTPVPTALVTASRTAAVGAMPLVASTNQPRSEVTAVDAVTTETRPAVMPVTANHADETVSCAPVTQRHNVVTSTRVLPDDPVTAIPEPEGLDDDVSRLVQEIAAGRVRPTVADIRRHLGCSQSRAAVLRRRLAERSFPA